MATPSPTSANNQAITGSHGPAIQLQNAGVDFGGQAAIQSLDLRCEPGEFVSVVGPSGCGKSTLLRVIAGLQSLSSGQLSVGDSVEESVSNQCRAGFVFQKPTLLPWRNVLANIALPLELRGIDVSKRRIAARSVRQLVGLAEEDEKKLPRMLSGGMQMRVSLARTLVTQPEVMLLDEPLAAVDDILRNQLLVELTSLWEQRAWTTILVTHNVAEAVFVSEKVLVMSPRPGRIVDEVTVPFEYPRQSTLRAAPEFARLTGQVSEALRRASL